MRIVEKAELNRKIKMDMALYNDKNMKMRVYHRITGNLKLEIRDAIITSRKYSFYKENRNGIINNIKCIFWGIKQSNYIKKRMIDIEGRIGENLMIYHPNIIISPKTIVGNNVKLHGSNCIGNNGLVDKAPKIGNNVDIGYGATIIGNIEIADDIIIGANALVNKSFLEKGVVIAGVPAKIVKYNNKGDKNE